MRETVRWGIIGCGDVTEKKSGPAFQKASGSALVAVMRRNAAKAEDYARRHGVPRWYQDAEALVRDPEVDAVYIATPPAQHAHYALLCAEARKPVYVEKPMARTYAECTAMVDAFERAGLPLFVAYYRRCLPRFLAIRDVLQSGEIGAVRAVQVTLCRPVKDAERNPRELPWRVQPELSGGGHFVDLASHTLDFLDFILGKIVQVQGVAVNQAGLYPAEDAVVASWRFDRGALGSGTWSFAAARAEDQVVVLGDQGTLSFATFADEPVVVQRGWERREIQVPHPEHIQQPMVQAVVDALRGQGESPSTGRTGMRTTWVMEQVLAGYRPGRGR